MLLLLVILFTLILLILGLLCRCALSRRLLRLRECFIWNIFLRLALEGSLEVLLCSLIELLCPLTDFSQSFSYSLSLISFVSLTLFPFLAF